MKTKQAAISATLLLAFGMVGCARSQTTVDGGTQPAITYDGGIKQLFSVKCSSCHGEAAPANGLRLDSWESLIAGSQDGEAVIPFSADHSLLVNMISKLEGGPHPTELGGDTLSAVELAAVKQWINEGAKKDEDGPVPYAESRHLLYACNQDDATISVIDMDANLVIRLIDLQDLGFSPNARPHHVAVEPGGEHWYVSLIGDDVVLKFNRENELVGRTDFERPGMLVADPEQDLLVVGRSMKAVNPPQRIGIIDRNTMEVEELDVFIARPHALALSRDDRYLYTASLAANQVVTMNRETEQIDLYNVPGKTHTLVQFAVSPDGSTLAVGGQLTGQFLFFDLSNPDAPVLVDSVQVGAAPWHPVYSPDGKFIYVGNKGANTVTVLDAHAHAVAAVISGRGIAQPHGSAMSPDGRHVYISSNNLDGTYKPRYAFGDNAKDGTVSVIDTASRRIVKVIEVGANAAGLGAVSGP